ncbi:inter-alpha-trypsin inhibitor heavy chain H3-like isoform X2 [Engraulis encrasicolus]|uniref:inter-alpha-trypsin inhibitor heavy chain H3-like isoform X2 n=1 Tax=Engraulis encrasicolus TaxID=184585 RepID=UPI002FD06756
MKGAAAAVFVLSLLLTGIDGAPTGTSRNWDIYSYHINSTVTSRYAITVITSRVANRQDNTTEIDFHVKIPKTAYISKFRMTIDGKTYDGIVKQKEEAKKQYTDAVSRGQSAGMISTVGRTLEDFKTSVAVAAHSKVTFELTYEELLQRRLGKYELLINTQPGQPVKDFKIEVKMYEKPGINFLEVTGSLAEKDLANAVTKSRAEKEAWVNFYPTHDQQTKCDGCGETGLNGDLKIMYDVNRPQSQGDVVEHGGYFVHFFAPTDLPRIPKNVVFLIDQSGSMHGRKMEQTRDALLRILEDLAEDDFFGLILFDNKVTPWKNELLQANPSNLDQAKAFVREITDRGSTDINAAVLKGVEMIKKHPREGSASILILLTDGDPTSGETNQGKIQSNAREAIGKKFPLYCLGFGMDVNFEFLQKMAKENSGVARRIYEDSDAALQLKGFYEEVATPLLTDVEMNYTGASNLTQTTFSHYYNGSEIVVAGHINDNNIEDFSTDVIAISRHSKVMYRDIKPTKAERPPAVLSVYENFLQRLWACLTVKQLLEKELTLTGEEKEAAKKQVVELSLKYSFVTPHTSMVVTKPEGESSQVADKPKEGMKQHSGGSTSSLLTTGGLPSISSRSGGYGARVASFPTYHHTPLLASSDDYDDADMMLSGLDYGASPPMLKHFGAPAGPPGLPGGFGSSGGYGGSRSSGSQPKSGRTASIKLSRPTSGAGRASSYPRHRPTSGPSFVVPTDVYFTSVVVPSTARFLLAADGQATPLCFDIPLGKSLKLLEDPASGFRMNGELSSSGAGGFQKIVIRDIAGNGTSLYTLEFSISDIIATDHAQGHDPMSTPWPGKEKEVTILRPGLTVDSLMVIIREGEADVTLGSTRVVILLHQQNGEKFLWPAVRTRPQGGTGIIGKPSVVYEKIPASKLRIHGEEVDTSRVAAQDYSIKAAPMVPCMLVSLRDALQRELSDFTVSSL